MKKIILFFITLLNFTFICCNKNSDGNEGNLLIGTWKLVFAEGHKLDECERQTTLEFTKKEFLILWRDGEYCGSRNEHGEWEKTGKETYWFKLDNGEVVSIVINFIDNKTIRLNIESGMIFKKIN